jgi:hypothetical protein
MSYLTGPRLHFAGRFKANVSTVNNQVTHFRNPDVPPTHGWNEGGGGSWELNDCTITSAARANGTVVRLPTEDPVVGLAFAQADSARIVDLDPQQQMVSQIWGLQVRLVNARGTALFGRCKVVAFSDLWRSRFQGQPARLTDTPMGAFYQSVLTQVEWGDVSDSQVLSELKQTTLGGLLSLKFNLDGFDMDPSSPTFATGRIVGAVGPALVNEPDHFLIGRHCMPIGEKPPTYFFAAIVDHARGKLRADLGNALTTASPGGPIDSSKRLEIGLLGEDQAFTSLGPVPVGGPGWYEQTAGICDFPADRALSAKELAKIETTPIAVRERADSGDRIIAREPPDGLHVRADEFVFRISAREHRMTTLHASRFGRPLANADIAITLDSSGLQPGIDGPQLAQPASALSFPSVLKTGADGRATLTLSAKSIDQPRDYIDGQVYGIGYRLLASDPSAGGYLNQWNFISVLLWSDFQSPPEPTWWDHVQPIFKQYANLYPVMRGVLDLDNYDSVVENKDRVSAVFMRPEDDPLYMPVTRDLSPAKRHMILNWLATTGNAGKPNLGTQPAESAVMAAAATLAPNERTELSGGKAAALQRMARRST